MSLPLRPAATAGTAPLNTQGKKRKIHVFASDFLPFPGAPRTAGGNRSLQVISALRAAGHQVTCSMPLVSEISRNNRHCIVGFSDNEMWASENFFEPELALNFFQPEVAVYCNVNCFRTIRRFAREVIHVLDLYGPLQFEGLLLDTKDPEQAMGDGPALERRCHDLVEKFRAVDYVVTVSERQKYFWAAYCSLAGFSFRDLNVLVCPVVFAVPEVTRKTATDLTIVYSGGFYPWQDPNVSLREAARYLDAIDGAELHIFGGPHAGLPNEHSVRAMLSDLEKHRSVTYHGYRPAEELAEKLSTAWCALELMEQNLERELAITGRTVEFLSTGTPVIYNDYSSLSALIERYRAGWTISPAKPERLGQIFDELRAGGVALVDELSDNARRLAKKEFDASQSMRALLDAIEGPLRSRQAPLPQTPAVTPSLRPKPAKPRMGRALVITPDSPFGALAELRVNNPFRGLQRQGIIEGYTLANMHLNGLEHDQQLYDVIMIQRAVPDFIYRRLRDVDLPFLLDVDDNLLARASYRKDAPETHIIPGLQFATALSCPTPRTVRALEKYSQTALAHKAFLAPNGCPFAETTSAVAERPTQIIWIQSDIAALTTSRDAIIRAVDDFSRQHSLPIVLIGKNVLERPAFAYQRIMGQLDFSANLQLLELAPTSIGVAPLETSADQETLDFVAGKSDLKMVLFAGYGHAGVYSSAPPYTDSPLRHCGSVIGNSYREWSEALEYEFREGWRKTHEHMAEVRAERNIDRIAKDSWAPALEECRLRRRLTGSEIHRVLTTAHYIPVPHTEGSPVAPGAPSPPPSPMQEYSGALEAAHRELENMRNSYSWKVTAPLRRIAKPLMERRKE